MRHVHSDKLERWLGPNAQVISDQMRNWYGPPIFVGNCRASVYATAGGEFIGHIKEGGFANQLDWIWDEIKAKYKRAIRRSVRSSYLNAGFSSFSDLLSEITVAGKRREFIYLKTGTTGVIGVTNTLFFAAGQPSAGGAAGAAPGGTAFDKTSVGAFPFANPTGGDFQSLLSGMCIGSVSGNCPLLYDRIFGVTKTMNSTATEAVTGVPTRYQNTVAGSADSAEGNFLFIETRAALPATAHNWTVCTYTNQAGTAAITLPSVTGNSSGIVNRLDIPAGQFFCQLAAGDSGIKALTQVQASALVASGNIDFVIGHALAFMPIALANFGYVFDGLNTALMPRIFDSACLSFLEVSKSAATATTYTGSFMTAAG